MTNTDTRNIEATAAQIGRLAAKGCEVVRVAVPDMAACSSFKANYRGFLQSLLLPIFILIGDWQLLPWKAGQGSSN